MMYSVISTTTRSLLMRRSPISVTTRSNTMMVTLFRGLSTKAETPPVPESTPFTTATEVSTPFGDNSNNTTATITSDDDDDETVMTTNLEDIIPPVDESLRTVHLAKVVAKEHKMNASQSKRIIDTIFDTMIKSVANGQEVHITGFGVFKTVQSKATTKRNPQKSEEIINVPAKHRIRFKAYKKFKDTAERIVE